MSSGNDSCQRTCESYVQPYSKPCDSASCEQLDEPLVRRIGKDGDAEAQGHLCLSFARSESGVSLYSRALRRASERRRGERGDRREREAAVARQLEREARERRPDEDRRGGEPVHESDCGSRGVRPRALGRSEDDGERKARGEAERRARRASRARTSRRARAAALPTATPSSASRRRPRRALAARAASAGRPRDDPGEEDQPAGEPGGGGARSLALEERHSPVAGDDGEAERRRLEHPEREQRRDRAGHRCAACPTRGKSRAAESRDAAASASSAALQYGARQSVASVSGGTTMSASPPPTIVAPP